MLQSQLQQFTSDEKRPVTVHLSQVLPDPSWKTSCSGCPGALYSSVLHATRFWDAVKGKQNMKGIQKNYIVAKPREPVHLDSNRSWLGMPRRLLLVIMFIAQHQASTEVA